MVLAQEESFCSKALTIQFHEKKHIAFWQNACTCSIGKWGKVELGFLIAKKRNISREWDICEQGAVCVSFFTPNTKHENGKIGKISQKRQGNQLNSNLINLKRIISL